MSSQIDEQQLGTDIYLPSDPQGRLLATPTGDLQLTTGRDNLSAALGRRFRVSPGSLVHRPDFGVGMVGFVEVSNDPTNRALLANDGRRNLLTDPRLREVSVSVALGRPGERIPSPDAVTVSAEVEIRHDRSPLTVTVIEES